MIELTQKQRDLLFKDLSARLSYGVIANIPLTENDNRVYKVTINWLKDFIDNNLVIIPYLRRMSSMTEEEKNTYDMFFNEDGLLNTSVDVYIDWLNENHFDYRGLIPMGLALPATEGMYNAKN